MKTSAKMTETMLLKAFSEVGRNNYEIALINLSGEWLKQSLETTQLLETLNMDFFSGYLARKEHNVSFLRSQGKKVPFYEQWLAEGELVFLDVEAQEIEQLCKHFECIKSDTLLVHPDGMARYEGFQGIRFSTVDFDLKLLQEILTSQN